MTSVPQYPYKFMAAAKPAGRHGQRCRKVPVEPGEHVPRGQGLVMVQFADGGRYLVKKSNLFLAGE